MKNTNCAGKIISVTAIATLVGAAIGVIFAPKKGSKTRKDIAKGNKNLQDKMHNVAKSAKDKVFNNQ